MPDGYHVLHSRTYGNALFFRGFMKDGDLRPAIESARQHYRVYPLDRAEDRPAIDFVDISGKYMNAIPPSDASLFESVATVVQEEPLEAVDPETRGLLAAVGIRKDAPFAPDARMQAILAEAAAVGNATARAVLFSPRDPELLYYPDGAWKMGYKGDGTDFSPGGVLDLDARTFYFCITDQISPAMWVKMVGKASQYAWADHDAEGRYLDGGRTYTLHLPPDIPVKDFWSLTVYDPQTRSMLQTDQRFPRSAASGRASRRTPTPQWTCTSVRSRPPATRRTGSRPCPARAGSWCFASTDRSSPGSTRPGGPARSSWSTDATEEQPSEAARAGDAGSGRAERSPRPSRPPTGSETRIGTLDFRDGMPSRDTLDKVYDHLDFAHAFDAFVNAIGASTRTPPPRPPRRRRRRTTSSSSYPS